MQELYPLHGAENLLFKTSISFIDHLQEFLSAGLTACTLVIPPLSELRQNILSIIDFLQVQMLVFCLFTSFMQLCLSNNFLFSV